MVERSIANELISKVRCQDEVATSSALLAAALLVPPLWCLARAIPLSTYRLQFNGALHASATRTTIVDYLDALGVSDCYASSYLKAVPGSPHGYDVADPTRLNPDIGTDAEYWQLDRRAAVARHGPHPRPGAQPHGHREVGESVVARRARERAELALRALLRHRLASGQGRAGRQGPDPDPRRSVRRGARAAGTATRLPRRRLRASATTTSRCRSRRTPTPRSCARRSTRWLDDHAGAGRRRAAEHPDRQPQPAAAQRARPGGDRDPRAREGNRQAAAGGARASAAPTSRALIDDSVRRLNGVAGQPRSFDALDAPAERAVVPAGALARRLRGDQLPALLRRQPARGAAHGRSGGLRRGASLRVRAGRARRGHRPAHRSRGRPVRAGRLPAAAAGAVLRRRQAATTASSSSSRRSSAPDEQLPSDWPVHGTTGYEFAAIVNNLFVDRRNERALDDVYRRFVRERRDVGCRSTTSRTAARSRSCTRRCRATSTRSATSSIASPSATGTSATSRSTA